MLSCVNALIAKWFPGTEKSTVVAIVTTGNQVIFYIFSCSINSNTPRADRSRTRLSTRQSVLSASRYHGRLAVNILHNW